MYRAMFAITLLCITIALAPAQYHAQADKTQAALDALVNDLNAETGSTLVVTVATPDATWTATAGDAHDAQVVLASDRFRIGSMSKTFLAVVALRLAEDGVLNLDDLASTWLPDTLTARIANADSVTLRNLLGMRSGIADYLATDEFWAVVAADPARVWTAQDALIYAYDLPAEFAPDAQFAYSNSNYLLLQIALETATTLPLHTLIRDIILDPLSLEATYTQISETLPGGFVSSLTDWDGDGTVEDVSTLNDGAGLGDGGLISNTADLTTFYHAFLRDQTLLNEDSMGQILAFQDAEGQGYSLGLNEWETDQLGAAWGHAGGVVGFLSLGVYLPDYETTVIILSAGDGFDIEQLAIQALALVLE
ncbi:MAG: beta-lactamase family protein [Armatimonadetes bacterium]|nr:beta-lactamase family protein [Anaerolineae bacterium]